MTAAWQTVERIAWAADPQAPSVCEINTVLSCSSVYPHWQSSALGIPNSLIALPSSPSSCLRDWPVCSEGGSPGPTSPPSSGSPSS